MELEKLNLERESLIYVEEDNITMKRRIDKLTFAAKLNEEIPELRQKITAGKDRINEKKLFAYHKYDKDIFFIPG